MARPRQFDPEQVLDRSMREFWAKGYRDTSVGDLVAATGVRPGSLYGAFEGGKRQLFIESLEALLESGRAPEARGAGAPGRVGCRGTRVFRWPGLRSDEPRRPDRLPDGQHHRRTGRRGLGGREPDPRPHGAARAPVPSRRCAPPERRGEIPAGIDPAAKATQLMATGMGLMVVGKTNPGGRCWRRSSTPPSPTSASRATRDCGPQGGRPARPTAPAFTRLRPGLSLMAAQFLNEH